MSSPRNGVFLPASTVMHPASPIVVKPGPNVLDPDVSNQRARRKTFDQFGPCWNDSEIDDVELTGYAPPSQRGEGRDTRVYSRFQAGSTVVPVSDVGGHARGTGKNSGEAARAGVIARPQRGASEHHEDVVDTVCLRGSNGGVESAPVELALDRLAG